MMYCNTSDTLPVILSKSSAVRCNSKKGKEVLKLNEILKKRKNTCTENAVKLLLAATFKEMAAQSRFAASSGLSGINARLRTSIYANINKL